MNFKHPSTLTSSHSSESRASTSISSERIKEQLEKVFQCYI